MDVGTVNALPRVQLVRAMGRFMRRPTHSWHIRQKPYILQPFMIAPVLPGESLKNMTMQARVVTDPIKNPLIGWWCEYYWFYCKHRDLDGRDTFANMVLVPGTDLSAFDRAAAVGTYHGALAGAAAGTKIDWTWECYRRIVDVYFRDKGDSYTNHQLDSLCLHQVSGTTWLDSVKDMTTFDEGGSPQDGTETLWELEELQRNYELLREMKLVTMTYEEFLTTYGVRPKREDLHEPELIRYVRDWKYPANTINPSDGAPTSAVSWTLAERADKKRFFREPGFVVGICVARPKVYFSKQVGAAVSMMRDARTWLPALLRDEAPATLKEFISTVAGNGPLGSNPTNSYLVDVKDLLMYGDQFLNFTLTATDAGLVALPTAAMEKRYVSSADIDALFVNAAGGKNLVRHDGVCDLRIAGALTDTT